MRQIKYMADRAGLKILDVKLNDINGGSFAVTVAKAGASYTANAAQIEMLLRREDELGLDTLAPYAAFQGAARAHRVELKNLLEKLKSEGRLVIGYGASTKGNVILQYCGITPQLLPCIAEVNAEKFGCFTPGTRDSALFPRPKPWRCIPITCWCCRGIFGAASASGKRPI